MDPSLERNLHRTNVLKVRGMNWKSCFNKLINNCAESDENGKKKEKTKKKKKKKNNNNNKNKKNKKNKKK